MVCGNIQALAPQCIVLGVLSFSAQAVASPSVGEYLACAVLQNLPPASTTLHPVLQHSSVPTCEIRPYISKFGPKSDLVLRENQTKIGPKIR